MPIDKTGPHLSLVEVNTLHSRSTRSCGVGRNGGNAPVAQMHI